MSLYESEIRHYDAIFAINNENCDMSRKKDQKRSMGRSGDALTDFDDGFRGLNPSYDKGMMGFAGSTHPTIKE